MAKTYVITNVSRQLIPVQVRRPGGDFYKDEQQIRIKPGETVRLPAAMLLQHQLDNCKLRHELKIDTITN